MTATCELRMPIHYVLMDNDEMEYLEGGKTFYNASSCYSKAIFAYNETIIFANNMSGVGTTTGYAGYGIVIAMYSYQYRQYWAGYQSGKGVYYYNAWKIIPV